MPRSQSDAALSGGHFMTKSQTVNYGHSMYAKLLAHAKNSNEDFTYLLFRYAMERMLYRISRSAYVKNFILKGASLFLVWKGQNYRVTKDADFLGLGIYKETKLVEVFKEICILDGCQEDGMLFLPDTVKACRIRENQIYGGIRVTLLGTLHDARIPLQIDIGYGDAVSPSPEDIVFPTILGSETPKLRAYTRYTVVAEKFNAMVELGPINSRLKDFYDIWLISRLFEFDGNILKRSIEDTFVKRKTDLPHIIPFAFTEEFYCDKQRQVQWKAFIRKARALYMQEDFSSTVKVLIEFFSPVLKALRSNENCNFFWSKGGPWSM
jgi:hypothetical protein